METTELIGHITNIKNENTDFGEYQKRILSFFEPMIKENLECPKYTVINDIISFPDEDNIEYIHDLLVKVIEAPIKIKNLEP